MKISLITVCFNSENTIRDTIESVISQTYKNIEYIIVDGASTDRTVEVIQSYGDKISQFISEKDDGIYVALNKGLQLASGDIIGFLHADDYYPNDEIISNVVGTFTNNSDCSIAMGDIAFIVHNNKLKRYYSGENFNFKIGIMPPHPAVFIKKKCYDMFGQFNPDYKIAGDYDLLFRFLELKKTKYQYNKDIIVYMSPGGTSNKNIFRTIKLNSEIYKIHKFHKKPMNMLSLLRKIPIRIQEVFLK